MVVVKCNIWKIHISNLIGPTPKNTKISQPSFILLNEKKVMEQSSFFIYYVQIWIYWNNSKLGIVFICIQLVFIELADEKAGQFITNFNKLFNTKSIIFFRISALFWKVFLLVVCTIGNFQTTELELYS